MAVAGAWHIQQDPPLGPTPSTHMGQYLAQTEELGHPKAQRAATKWGRALIHRGQRHLSPKVPGQQLGEKHGRARAPAQQPRPATWPGPVVGVWRGLPIRFECGPGQVPQASPTLHPNKPRVPKTPEGLPDLRLPKVEGQAGPGLGVSKGWG